MKAAARSTSRLATATSRALPASRIARQFFLAIPDAPRMAHRHTVSRMTTSRTGDFCPNARQHYGR
jgi:hypothetical protein